MQAAARLLARAGLTSAGTTPNVESCTAEVATHSHTRNSTWRRWGYGCSREPGILGTGLAARATPKYAAEGFLIYVFFGDNARPYFSAPTFPRDFTFTSTFALWKTISAQH